MNAPYVTLTVRHHFDAAHYLPCHPGKCKNIHGHTWYVEVVISGGITQFHLKEENNPPDSGMVADFGLIKSVIDELDHTYLNEHFDNPTAEMIAVHLYDAIQLALEIRKKDVTVNSVTVWESENCSATYSGTEWINIE